MEDGGNNGTLPCLFCSNKSREHSTAASDRVVFILHKLLQIPLWTSCKFLSNPECFNLCEICEKLVAQGMSLVEQVERLQLQLQTLQATLQNQLLTLNRSSFNSSLSAEQDKMRSRIKDEIRNNLNQSIPLGDDNHSSVSSLTSVSPGAGAGTVQTPVYIESSLLQQNEMEDVEIISEIFNFSFPPPHGRKKRRYEEGGSSLTSASSSSISSIFSESTMHHHHEENSVEAFEACEMQEPMQFTHQPIVNRILWSGTLQWRCSVPPAATDFPCRIASNNPTIPNAGWPPVLYMQLIPTIIFSHLGLTRSSIRQGKTCIFLLPPGTPNNHRLVMEMSKGYAGVVSFMGSSCEIKIIILLHNSRRNVFIGMIPEAQAAFVEKLRCVIKEQKEIQGASLAKQRMVVTDSNNLPEQERLRELCQTLEGAVRRAAQQRERN